jgi:hypothetical protein
MEFHVVGGKLKKNHKKVFIVLTFFLSPIDTCLHKDNNH